jgi:hypothetical protein
MLPISSSSSTPLTALPLEPCAAPSKTPPSTPQKITKSPPASPEKAVKLSKEQLAEILAKSPVKPSSSLNGRECKRAWDDKELGSPSKKENLHDIKKRHLEHLGPEATTSPFKNTTTSSLSSPLGARAVQHLIDNNLTTGRNVAIIIVKLGDGTYGYMIKATEGPPSDNHAELKCFDALPEEYKDPKLITLVFSLREFCKTGGSCHQKFKVAVDKEKVEIVFSFTHPGKEAEIRKALAEKGVRDVTPKSKAKARLFGL